ncbi:hypothetical protein OAX11_05325, partial [Flavobacteriaceae bacterium]|nr:hypothetical protein [Flavobacteriaceae bacterium]
MTSKKYISVLLILLNSFVFSQGITCDLVEPACAGGGFVFENVSNGTVGEVGPNYGCLGSVPNPSWFYFNVAASGDISFSIEQNTQDDFSGTGLDVDFICYGPFTNTDDYCTMLTAENTTGCSFSPDFIENFSITNAIGGELYILLITNYEGTPGFINLAQETSSTGSTDCSILTESVVLCETDSYTIDLTLSNPGTSYSWTYDNGSGPIVISGETSPILNLPIDLDGDSILDPISGNYIATINGVNGTNTVINAITYNSVPSAFNVADLRLCDDDDLLDTFKEFDFTNQIIDVSGGQTDVIVNFYLNIESAENNTDALNLASNNLYTNTSNPQEIFIRIENSQNPNCFETTSFTISTDVPLIANVPTIDEIALCDIGNDNLEVFDLVNQFQSGIVGSQSNVNINYYDANNSLIINPNAYNVTLPEETITIEIEYIDTDNVCSSVSTSIKMILDSQPIIEGVATLEQCDTDSNGIVAFNLNEANQILSTNFVNENFVYYNSLSDAQLGDVSNAIINTEAFSSTTGISVFASVTNDKGCVNYGEVMLLVGTSSIPLSTSYSFSECDDNYDGIITFDFSDAESEIFSIFPTSINILISYYENEEDALSELDAIPDISNHQNSNSLYNQSIWVRVDSQDLNGCLGLGEHIFLTVDPLPNEIVIDNVNSCSDDEIGNFDLSNATLQAQNGDTNI